MHQGFAEKHLVHRRGAFDTGAMKNAQRPLTARTVHKYIGLSLALFWLLQIMSGLAIHFRTDMDDHLLGAQPATVSPAAIGAATQRAAAAGYDVSSIWISGGVEGQLDVYAAKDGADYTLRIDSAGQMIRARPDSQSVGDGAMYETMKKFHQTLLAGDVGEVVIGVSGLFLLVSIAMGLVAGWRSKAMWRSVTRRPTRLVSGQANLLGWHRFLGYWIAVPLFALAASGVMLSFADPLKDMAGVAAPSVTAEPGIPDRIDAAGAVDRALARFPGSRFTAVDMAGEEGVYRVRIHAGGELPRSYGATAIYIDRAGQIVRVDDARTKRGADALFNALYPFHTGQILGIWGRVAAFLCGAGALAMLVLGMMAWARSKRSRATKPVRRNVGDSN
ncbi:MAG: PepSY domain-containing protein [Alphaproteobacteria bacterium]|nr:PepSY domain-containing protein [Alphaproteobacteria bacterium]MBU1825034.1 PepSY domain-containing protein [Alphaproteobacteria bacterium]